MTGLKPRNRWSAPGSSPDPDRSSARGSDDFSANRRAGAQPAAPQSIFSSIYSALPPILRDLLPFGPGGPGGGAAGEDKPPDHRQNMPSWQDVCFIHAMPGE